jgi:ureidoglycolate hydrolase
VEPSGGDLALVAKAATTESFAPFGRVLGPGDRLALGKKGSILLSVEVGRPGPRRVRHLLRYPLARRIVFPLEEVAMLVLALPPGERPVGPPSAFRVLGGAGLLVEAGVWHHGPVPLTEVGMLEVLETTGPADRIDRRSLADLVGHEAARIGLPEEVPPPAGEA